MFQMSKHCDLCSKMAAPTTDAAASLSPGRMVFSCILSCKLQCFCTYSSRLPVFKRTYSREFLLDVGRTTFLELNSAHAKELRDLGLLWRPTPSPTPTTASRPQRRRYKRRERKQKRGKHGGIRARLAANPHKPAIPTILLANVRSLDNKLSVSPHIDFTWAGRPDILTGAQVYLVTHFCFYYYYYYYYYYYLTLFFFLFFFFYPPEIMKPSAID